CPYQTKHFGKSSRIPYNGRGENGDGRISHFSIVDIAAALVNLTADVRASAQAGVQEGCIYQVVKSGRNQQTLQRAVEEDSEVSGVIDKGSQAVDDALDG